MLDVWQALDQLAKYKASSAGGDSLNEGRYLRSLHPMSSLAELTVPLLQNIEKQLKSDLQIVREVHCLHLYSVDLAPWGLEFNAHSHPIRTENPARIAIESPYHRTRNPGLYRTPCVCGIV